MSNSLRDQLVKAGLATSSQAKKAEKQQRAEDLAARRGSSGRSKVKAERKPTPTEKARQLQKAKAQHNKAVAQKQNDKYAQRALRAEIRQIVQQNDLRKKVSDDDAVPYNFVHGKKIKRIYVSKAERDQLSDGRLVVINNDGTYHFVKPDVARKIEQRDPKRIIVAHDNKATDKPASADDEYYAKFEVPDDLDW